MSSDALAKSQEAGGAHHTLAQLVGEWEGPSQLWIEPGKLADESRFRATIRPLHGGRFVLHEYTGEIQEKPVAGTAIYGCDLATGSFQAAWVDTWHTVTALMFFEGEAIQRGFQVLGHYADPAGGPDWGWRIAVEIVDPDHLQITMYNITPQGEEAKAVETSYARAA